MTASPDTGQAINIALTTCFNPEWTSTFDTNNGNNLNFTQQPSQDLLSTYVPQENELQVLTPAMEIPSRPDQPTVPGNNVPLQCPFNSDNASDDDNSPVSKRLRTTGINAGEHSNDITMTEISESASSPPTKAIEVTPDPRIRSNPSKDNRYSRADTGPFLVFVESLKQNIGRLHPMAIGKLLYCYNSALKHDIVNISANGKNRLKIELKSAAAANILIQSSVFASNDLEAYIPGFLIHRLGIIRDVDVSLSEEELERETCCPYPVIKVKRFTKRSNATDRELTPIPVCLFTFRSQVLPSHVTILGTRCPVAPYVAPVIQCRSCLRFGHRQNQCRSSVRCNRCSGPHPVEQCTESTLARCVHCQGEHVSTDRSCPEYTRQREMKQIAAQSYVNFSASQHDRSYSQATATIPQYMSHTEFPPLSGQSTQNYIPPPSPYAVMTPPVLQPIQPFQQQQQQQLPPSPPILVNTPHPNSPYPTPHRTQNPHHSEDPASLPRFPPPHQRTYAPQQRAIPPITHNPYPPQPHNKMAPTRPRYEVVIDQILQVILFIINGTQPSPIGLQQLEPLRALISNIFSADSPN